MNKLVKGMFALGMGALMVGCSSGTSDSGSQQINVVSREEGSGTRGAFVELFGVQEGDVDNTTSAAEVTNSTSVMISTVQGNEKNYFQTLTKV